MWSRGVAYGGMVVVGYLSESASMELGESGRPLYSLDETLIHRIPIGDRVFGTNQKYHKPMQCFTKAGIIHSVCRGH